MYTHVLYTIKHIYIYIPKTIYTFERNSCFKFRTDYYVSVWITTWIKHDIIIYVMMDIAGCRLYIIIDLKQPNNLENVRILIILINDCSIGLLFRCICITAKLIHIYRYDTFIIYSSLSCLPIILLWNIGWAYY